MLLYREIHNVQNPALGAVLLWRFSCGYINGHRFHNPTPVSLLFLVLPILLHEVTYSFVKGTNRSSGLRKFSAKFGEAKTAKQDLLVAIHNRSKALRKLTLASLRMSLAAHLLKLETTAVAIPLSRTTPRVGIPSEIRKLMSNSEKLGYWCAQLSLHEISSILKIRY